VVWRAVFERRFRAVLVGGLSEECRVRSVFCTPYAHLRERFQYLKGLPARLENSYAACACEVGIASAAGARMAFGEASDI